MTQELHVVIVGLFFYILGATGPNHHPRKSFKAFGAGVVHAAMVIVGAYFAPGFLRRIGGGGSAAVSTVFLWVAVVSLSTCLVGLRYYRLADRIRRWQLSSGGSEDAME